MRCFVEGRDTEVRIDQRWTKGRKTRLLSTQRNVQELLCLAKIRTVAAARLRLALCPLVASCRMLHKAHPLCVSRWFQIGFQIDFDFSWQEVAMCGPSCSQQQHPPLARWSSSLGHWPPSHQRLFRISSRLFSCSCRIPSVISSL